MHQKQFPDGEWRAFATAAFGGLAFVLTVVAIVIVCLMLSGCTATRYVEVPGPTHTEIHHRTDTVHQTDTLIDHKETISRIDDALESLYHITEW